MLAELGLLADLQRHLFFGYPLNLYLQGPFKGARITPLQNEYNPAMSHVRSSVEWVFRDTVNYFAFMDFKKNLKIRFSAVGKMYLVYALLTNARTSLCFGLDPPPLEVYFQ